MVSTHFKNSCQIGSFLQLGVKIKNIWNHHLANIFCPTGMASLQPETQPQQHCPSRCPRCVGVLWQECDNCPGAPLAHHPLVPRRLLVGSVGGDGLRKVRVFWGVESWLVAKKNEKNIVSDGWVMVEFYEIFLRNGVVFFGGVGVLVLES